MNKDRTAQMGAVPLFSHLSKKELRAIDQLMTTVAFDSGTVLMEQGSPGRDFLIISEGTAEVSVQDVGVVAQLGPGDFMGELSVLTGAPRNATITTSSALTAEVLNRRELNSLLDAQPVLGNKIFRTAIERLQAGEDTTAS